MLRLIGEGAALFLLPFVLYAGLLAAQRRFSILREASADGSLIWLTAAGLGLAIVGLLALGLFSDRYKGSYVPAHLEGGRLVPGHME